MRDNIGIDDRNTAKHLDVDLIVDSSSTHKIKAVKAWLAKHPRFQLLFIPTSSSWLNLVERFFADVTRKRIRRGVFTSVAELEAAIEDDLDTHTLDPKPFVWTKTADVILAKTARASAALDAVKNGNQALESCNIRPAFPRELTNFLTYRSCGTAMQKNLSRTSAVQEMRWAGDSLENRPMGRGIGRA